MRSDELRRRLVLPSYPAAAAYIYSFMYQVLDRAPIFYNYEDAWPITAYLRSAMKGYRRSDARTPVVRPRLVLFTNMTLISV